MPCYPILTLEYLDKYQEEYWKQEEKGTRQLLMNAAWHPRGAHRFRDDSVCECVQTKTKSTKDAKRKSATSMRKDNSQEEGA